MICLIQLYNTLYTISLAQLSHICTYTTRVLTFRYEALINTLQTKPVYHGWAAGFHFISLIQTSELKSEGNC